MRATTLALACLTCLEVGASAPATSEAETLANLLLATAGKSAPVARPSVRHSKLPSKRQGGIAMQGQAEVGKSKFGRLIGDENKMGIWGTNPLIVSYLEGLPIYRENISPFMRGLEIGMAHGYWVPGPFTIGGPLRNSVDCVQAGAFSAAMMGVILTLGGCTAYGIAQGFDQDDDKSKLKGGGWFDFRNGAFIGWMGGAIVYFLAEKYLLGKTGF